MGTAFDVALDVLFADPNGATSGTYTPAGGGTATAVAVVVARIDFEQPLGLVGARNPGWEVRVRRSQVPSKPAENSTITVGTTTYTVQAVTEDHERVEWILDCRG